MGVMGRDAGIRHGEGRSGMLHAEVYFVMGFFER